MTDYEFTRDIKIEIGFPDRLYPDLFDICFQIDSIDLFHRLSKVERCIIKSTARRTLPFYKPFEFITQIEFAQGRPKQGLAGCIDNFSFRKMETDRSFLRSLIKRHSSSDRSPLIRLKLKGEKTDLIGLNIPGLVQAFDKQWIKRALELEEILTQKKGSEVELGPEKRTYKILEKLKCWSQFIDLYGPVYRHLANLSTTFSKVSKDQVLEAIRKKRPNFKLDEAKERKYQLSDCLNKIRWREKE